MPDAPAPLPPIRRQIVVPTSPARAFHLWTEDLSTWWPLDRHSVFGADATVSFEEGEMVERSTDGRQTTWGSVLAWQPGSLLRLTWHPGHDPDEATEVTVRFDPVDVAEGPGAHTLVTIEHRGWERRADALEARADYERGWPSVVGHFADAARPNDRVWLVLAHAPGPTAPEDAPLTTHPDFAEHLAFLRRLADDGVVVGAGPLVPPGALGDVSGMTVIRVPASDEDRYRARATDDDQAVARGLLQVSVSRWAVALS